MSRRRDHWIGRVRAAERESEAVALGVELLAGELARDPSSLAAKSLANQDFVAARSTARRRTWSACSRSSRGAWARGERETTEPRITDLIDAFAARRVRRVRDSQVHGESEPAEPLTLPECRRHACRSLAFLAADWPAT